MQVVRPTIKDHGTMKRDEPSRHLQAAVVACVLALWPSSAIAQAEPTRTVSVNGRAIAYHVIGEVTRPPLVTRADPRAHSGSDGSIRRESAPWTSWKVHPVIPGSRLHSSTFASRAVRASLGHAGPRAKASTTDPGQIAWFSNGARTKARTFGLLRSTHCRGVAADGVVGAVEVIGLSAGRVCGSLERP